MGGNREAAATWCSCREGVGVPMRGGLVSRLIIGRRISEIVVWRDGIGVEILIKRGFLPTLVSRCRAQLCGGAGRRRFFTCSLFTIPIFYYSTINKFNKCIMNVNLIAQVSCHLLLQIVRFHFWFIIKEYFCSIFLKIILVLLNLHYTNFNLF